jgi:hypothetical protein
MIKFESKTQIKMPDKIHRCVNQVMKQGKTESSAWAICNASLGKMVKAHKQQTKQTKKK